MQQAQNIVYIIPNSVKSIRKSNVETSFKLVYVKHWRQAGYFVENWLNSEYKNEYWCLFKNDAAMYIDKYLGCIVDMIWQGIQIVLCAVFFECIRYMYTSFMNT